MVREQILVASLLIGAMALWIRGRWRHDVVAFGALMLGVVVGVVPEDRALSGFGHPAVFTVAAVLILSRALQVSGVFHRVAVRLARLRDRPRKQLGAMAGMTTGLSTFMNNVGALALVMPIAMDTCAKSDRPASRVLMPIGFAAILGGLVTLVGTPPNIIVAEYRAQATGASFAMFDYLPVGLPVALIGVAWLVFRGPRALPERRGNTSTGEPRRYITELRVPHGSPLIGSTIAELTKPVERDFEVLGLVRSEVALHQSIDYLPLRPGDVIQMRADSRVFEDLSQQGGLELVGEGGEVIHRDGDIGTLEVVVPRGSRFEGRTATGLRLHSRMGINILAISREDRAPTARLGDVAFRAGDVLLLHGDLDTMAEVAQTYGALPLAERGVRPTRPRYRWPPAAIFLASIALTATGLLPVHIAFGLAVTALAISGSVTIRQLYDAVDWSVIVLLGALIPLGDALEQTGGTKVIANGIVTISSGLGDLGVLAVLMLTTTVLTNFINNAATAVVMAPVALAVAENLERDADGLLMAVALGASCAFATPIGHQNNVLVMGPGGYRFSDFMRLGVPLTIITMGIGLPLIHVVWGA